MAATGNGVPPSSNVQLVNNLSPGLPLRDLVSFSPSTLRQDLNVDGALCLRGLLTGSDASALALQRGIRETLRNGNLQRKPAIIVHGRADALIPVNHSSRPYTALNKRVEGRHSQLVVHRGDQRPALRQLHRSADAAGRLRHATSRCTST